MKISKKNYFLDEIYVHQLDDVNVSLQELEDAIKDFKSQRGDIRSSRIGNSDYYLVRYVTKRIYTYRKENAVFIQDDEGVQVHDRDEGRGWTLIKDWKLKDIKKVKEELITLFNIDSKVYENAKQRM